jgi:hypothetical protein
MRTKFGMENQVLSRLIGLQPDIVIGFNAEAGIEAAKSWSKLEVVVAGAGVGVASRACGVGTGQ